MSFQEKRKKKKIQSYKTGHWAEMLAAAYMMLRGYKILKRRYKTKLGEIDLIALRGKSLVFIEVKARKRLADGAEAVHVYAQRRIENAARYFLAANPGYVAHDMRFMVVIVIPPLRIVCLDNAWEAHS